MSLVNWLTDLEKAKTNALNENKFILLDFFSPT